MVVPQTEREVREIREVLKFVTQWHRMASMAAASIEYYKPTGEFFVLLNVNSI